jgi:hypothetical protein
MNILAGETWEEDLGIDGGGGWGGGVVKPYLEEK